jgi:Na+-driven multidrug efflux pump
MIWLFNSQAAVIRATGNMAVPAIVTLAGTAILVPLSPVLIFGRGPIPALGIAGGAIALVAYYADGTSVLWAYLRSPKSVLHQSLRGVRLQWQHFRDILRVGAAASLVSLSTNLVIMIGTALVGDFGTAAIAGYGTGARLEYLLVPLVFGLGAPLVAMVGTSIGAGNRGRALHVAWIGAGIATALTEAIGLAAAVFPRAWLSLFDTDPVMLDAGARYLRVVGPFYGMLGLALSLYFASQGAGRVAWPVAGNLVRLAIAAAGGSVALRWGGDLSHVFLAQSAGLVAFGLITAVSVAGGAWFGRLRWPAKPSAVPHNCVDI